MRLNINLASQPYQDLNRFLRKWVPAVAVFVIASCALVAWAWVRYSEGREINGRINVTREQIHRLDVQRETATNMLAEPANKGTADTSRFINQLIAKKAFSWTRVFMQLEQIMPDRLHVVSLAPELNKANQLQMTIHVAGDSREQAVELVRRIEKSPSFRSAVLRSEQMVPPEQARSGDAVQFDISAIYVPTVAPSPKPVKGRNAESETASGEGSAKSVEANAGKKGVHP
jgi:hypothetical protein